MPEYLNLRDRVWLRLRLKCHLQGCGVLIFCWTPTLTMTPALKKSPDSDSGFKVEHRLLTLCDCDVVLRERCRQTNSEDLKK